MTRVTALVIAAAIILSSTDLFAQTKPGLAQAKPRFAGQWKVERAAGQALPLPGQDVIITQDATSMTLQDLRAQAPGPAKLTYKLDGSSSTNVAAGRGGASDEQVSKAAWSGNTLVVTTTTGAGEEKRTFTTDGDYLVVETSVPAANGGSPEVTTVTYVRYVRGWGG